MKKIFIWVFVLVIAIFVIFLWIKNDQNIDEKIAQNMIQVIVKDEQNTIHNISSGYMIDEETAIASLHATYDDQFSIYINDKKWKKNTKNIERDMVVLRKNEDKKFIHYDSEKEWKKSKIGEKIFSYVWRENTWIKLTGQVTATNILVSGYLKNWKTYSIRPHILTDLPVLPGDSGAPIWNEKYEIVGMIHIQ